MRFNLSRPVLAVAAAAVLSAAPAAQAADTNGNYTVSLNQDSFFGFYPSFNGLFTLSDSMDFSFYGILWTRPGLSLVSTSGADLWTEFGAGVNIKRMGGALQIKPQLGITNGSLLSGGTGASADGSNAFDGVVPNLTVNYNGSKFEAEWYSGYYLALRNRSDNAALDFLHYWANAGYKVNKNFSVGGHFEHLRNTRDTYPGGDVSDAYRWLGVYSQFSLPKGFVARFTFGDDISANPGNFYKLNVAMSF
jgi:hypothetical protein